MVDAMDLAFLHPDKDGRQEGGGGSPPGRVSPLASSALSSSSSPPPFYSPPPSPPALDLGGDKAGMESDLLPLSWLDHPVQPRSNNVLSDLDWMAERVDLSDFDLDSLIGSCSPVEDAPSSPEDLLASLDSPMELDSFPLPTLSSAPSASFNHVPSVSGSDPSPQEELEVKSEPASPGPSPCVVDSPSSPAFTLDLGSEVDISESEVKPVVASVVPQVPKIVLSLSPTRIILVLTPKNGVGVTPAAAPRSPPASPPQKSPRSRPYPDPKHRASPPSPSTDDLTSTSKAPRDKKQKKMEQNKTAATRYRQKKRAEQDSLLVEHAQLERKNVELTEKAESMTREIEYLKELMEEVRQTSKR
uniref:Cyclic AMP-dependent transcription factor ATF-4 n=1 Tax=Xiphophorus couchianus TaxID=32473 RepID=A0A3B5LTM5_9TELE